MYYLIEVTKAKNISDYKILLTFNNGEERTVDLKEELYGEMFEPLKNKNIFMQFRVDEELGTIVWPNGADLAPYSLYDLGKPYKPKNKTRKKNNTKPPDNHRIYFMKIFPVLFFLFLSITCFGQTQSQALLNNLEGLWYMKGNVLSKPVEYNAEGTWILQNQFLSFHMKDAANPPEYEATLFIGIDSSQNQYVAHWLDSFGGAGSRVVGFGELSAEKIEIIYSYEEGKFSNSFTYDPHKDEWKFVIESEESDGQWSVFAKYNIVRKKD